MTFVYLTIAVVSFLILIAAVYRMFHVPKGQIDRDLPDLPMTPLQKRAWFGLVIGVVVSTAIAILLVLHGPTEFFDTTSTRFTFYGLLAGGGLLWLVAYLRTRPPAGVGLDERDRIILERAPTIQAAIVILSIAAWTIVLTEMYQAEGAVPIVFLNLIFWSSWIVHMLGLSVGILYGYRRAQVHAEG